MALDGTKLNRRVFLAAAGCATALLPARASLLAPAAAPRARQEPEALLAQPPVIRSQNGVLDATLTAAPGKVSLGKVNFEGELYNGSYLPPLLRARLGDVMRVRLRNHLPKHPTNMHFHGMSVSPNGASDNVFIRVDAGQDFQYEVKIPAHDRQGPGLFWYHPHSHGYVWEQLSGGMAGGIVVDGFEEYYPIVKNIPERFFFIQNREHKELDIFPINGQLNPAVAMRPGEVEFWRIANINATEFIKIGIPGVPFYVLATDGHPLSRPQRQTQLFIGPGQRFEALVIGPRPGEYALSTIPFPNEAWDEIEPAEQLATIVSSGAKPSAQPSATQIMRQQLQGRRWIDEIRKAPIVHRRKLVYSRNSPRSVFFIDGMTMCEDMVNQTVKLGDTEEWTIINTDEQYHSFHIHQTPFLVTEIDGVRQHEDSLHDTFSTTPATNVGSTSLKVVIPFTDPVIVGKFVYHCHAVDHEDEGMMGVIQVVA